MTTLWTIATFVFVCGTLLWVAYALIRPFTHVRYDHRNVFHPPWLEDFDSGPARRGPPT